LSRLAFGERLGRVQRLGGVFGAELLDDYQGGKHRADDGCMLGMIKGVLFDARRESGSEFRNELVSQLFKRVTLDLFGLIHH